MIFSSLLFIFRFLPIVLIFYYLVPRCLKNLVLFIFSLIFYAWGEPIYIFLMLISIMIAYIGGLLIDWLKQTNRHHFAKRILILFSIISLSLLAFFKYADFTIDTVNHIAKINISLLKLALPIGISFYTFQTLSYMIDVYCGEAIVQKNLISFGTYVAMFPQLIAGPIVQYKTIDQQLRTRQETAEEFAQGIHLFMVGLGKKVLLANNIGAVWDTIQSMNSSEIPVLTAWLGLMAFAFQIYFDFSAYSDMAIGLGHMFGFQFLKNFDYPYISKSLTEFWHRWHISLGIWFREYIYIPLGGNRVSRLRWIGNIMIVWIFTGIWHGASWNFVVWGFYYGVMLLIEKFILRHYLEKLPSICQHIYCLFFVCIGWSIFAFDHFGAGLDFMKSLFGMYGQNMMNKETIYLLYNHMILFVLCILGSTHIPCRIGYWICQKLKGQEMLQMIVQNVYDVTLFLLSIAWLVNATFQPFLYFRF